MADNELPVPNRWHTTVSVEVYINGRMRHINWFSDLQMAYIWVTSQERVHNEPLSYNRNFVEFADAMDRRWQDRPNESCTMATSNSYKYKLTYEPDVPYRPEEEQEIRRQQTNRRIITTNVAVHNHTPLEILDNRQINHIQFVFHP